MRLLFLYTQDRASSPASFAPEGLFGLFSAMIEAKIVDQIHVMIDSNADTGVVEYFPGLTAEVGRIDEGILKPSDVVFTRGGFKAWLPFLEMCRNRGHWMLFYGANTGRGQWPFWHVIFDDTSGKGNMLDSQGRLCLDYRKPVNESIFRCYPDAEPIYDLCIGASHVHDKKGQWRGVRVAQAYREMYDRGLRCVLPGAIRRGVETNKAIKEIMDLALDIDLPGMLSRHKLATVLNKSRLFCHLGSGGQGDRGPMEAMRCGCPLIIGFPRYHAPWVWQNDRVCFVPEDPDDYQAIAEYIHDKLSSVTPDVRRYVSAGFSRQAGIASVIVPRMKRLFNCLKELKTPDVSALAAEYGL